MGRLAWLLVSAFAAAALSAAPAHAQPELPGPLAFTAWDAGSVAAAGASIPTRVFYPTGGGGPYPIVGVVHGASRNGSYMRVMAETLASRGFVAVVPNMPCNVFGCDHDANANQLVALLDWAVAQGSAPGSPIAGLVDGGRRGLVGHSWGALSSHLAAARDARVHALVLLDPNDDGTVGADAASSVGAPTAQLLAERSGACNNQWNEGVVTPALSGASLQLTIAGSGHCDVEEPTDGLCALACGGGDAATTPLFRRYAVAWIACVLGGDATVMPWVGGASLDADVTAGAVTGLATARLDTLACRGGMLPDGGTGPATDAGTVPGADSGSAPGVDGGAARDAGATARLDAGPDAGADGGGCGCAIVSAPASGGALATFAAGMLALLRSRRPRSARR